MILKRILHPILIFFADDTMLYSIVKDPVVSANALNHGLDLIYRWVYQWKMEFHPDPTEQATEVLVSCKKSSPNHPQLFFNGAAVINITGKKHLGPLLEKGLSFEKHLNEKIIKAKKNIGILKYLSKFLPIKILDQMYKALVRSLLDYCDIIYHMAAITHQPPLGMTLHSIMEKLEKVHYQAALAITGTWQGSSRSKIYEELGWENLSDRRKYRRVLQIHKIISNNTPSYLKDKLPLNCSELFNGNIHTTFHVIKCKSNRYMNSFFPDAIASWNLFMEMFKYNDVPSICVLKKDIKARIRPESKTFFKIHDPVGLRYLFQLRVSLSPLKGHKYCHNFIDTPSGICLCTQGIEGTSHFLFSCHLYATRRVTLVSSVNEILQKFNLNYLKTLLHLYLYGNASLNNTGNKKIILSTIK